MFISCRDDENSVSFKKTFVYTGLVINSLIVKTDFRCVNNFDVAELRR